MNVLETRSRLTDRYQTTIPSEIRQVLGLGKRDDIGWLVDEDGNVRLVNRSHADDVAEEDPALGPFLQLIEDDLRANASRIAAYGADQAAADQAFLTRRKNARKNR